jgi:hypothetical protein
MPLESKTSVNPYKETVLGFDVRAHPTSWPSERRLNYLLCNIAEPLSVDIGVWPSNRNTALRGEIETDPGFVEKFLEKKSENAGIWLIAITLQKEPYRKEFSNWGIGDIDPSWKFLGYDIADQAMLSGLSNCMYNEQEINILQPVWSPHLNEHHLFNDSACAIKFRTLTEIRVAEHAPFAVYGIYKIN